MCSVESTMRVIRLFFIWAIFRRAVLSQQGYPIKMSSNPLSARKIASCGLKLITPWYTGLDSRILFNTGTDRIDFEAMRIFFPLALLAICRQFSSKASKSNNKEGGEMVDNSFCENKDNTSLELFSLLYRKWGIN